MPIITKQVVENAANIGDVNFLEILLKNLKKLLENKQFTFQDFNDGFNYIFNLYVDITLNKNDIVVIKYFIDNGICLENIAEKAAESNKHEIIPILHKSGFKFTKNISNIAGYYNSKEFLKFLHKIGFEFDEETFKFAAEIGNIDYVKFLHDIKCPINPDECYIRNEAIRKWGIENNITFPTRRKSLEKIRTLKRAVKKGINNFSIEIDIEI